jgi:5'-nucleotidase
VKLAKNVLLKDRKIDLCVSGVNHGSNASINIIYSGTMSAAMEASLEGIDSIGFSLLDYSFEADFSASKFYAEKIISQVLDKKLVECNLLNVNIPKGSISEIKGIKVVKQGEGNWIEEFQEGTDPRGQKYYWLSGYFENNNPEEHSDINALAENYVSVVPSGHDLTNYSALKTLSYLEKI